MTAQKQVGDQVGCPAQAQTRNLKKVIHIHLSVDRHTILDKRN